MPQVLRIFTHNARLRSSVYGSKLLGVMISTVMQPSSTSALKTGPRKQVKDRAVTSIICGSSIYTFYQAGLVREVIKVFLPHPQPASAWILTRARATLSVGVWPTASPLVPKLQSRGRNNNHYDISLQSLHFTSSTRFMPPSAE
ncbi:hypothetical protein RRG08_066252 [Elysia crispata]|uniref:Uncharacterized protein n=1 Tax=Elysia crispata TaxID=231223 RepID=A0AAE1EE01_9GAST|nr:hypothetical protein RRG08_066252 [Elysia crispata]